MRLSKVSRQILQDSMSTTDNQDRPNAYSLMRYGLTSALVGGGWFSFDKGDWGHDVLWWYDEYLTPLGAPRGAPQLVQGGDKGTGIVTGVWQRDFEHGTAIVNSTDQRQTVPLAGVYEKDSWTARSIRQ